MTATSLSIEPDDFGFSPFAQRGGLGNLSAVALSQSNWAKVEAHQIFGVRLNSLLDELNGALVA